MKHLYIVLFLLSGMFVSVAQNKLVPTDAGSKVHFVIKNFAINTGGDFKGLQGSIIFNPNDLQHTSFDVSVEASTIDTDSEMRDEHLKEDEYFDVTRFPKISIKSTQIVHSSKAGRYYFFGTLTIKGISKAIEFGFSATPKTEGLLFEGEFNINRRDFNVGEKSISLNDNVKISLSIMGKNAQ
ncbi:MAG: YceI family protein [Ferruginibacter sp.]